MTYKILENIKKEHIIKAIELIDNKTIEIPSDRNLTRCKYELVYNNKFYPPKFVISVANEYANGEWLEARDFNGGIPLNNFLEKLGFSIKKIKK